jgi:hypothetical protein
LGHLDPDGVHEIEILSGAFMLMRKEALDKVGLLDETFFMYGEAIDLSWRIIQGGYKNYYFPKTTIIHYKGESTKKGSLNYVFVFYNAMIIFARKHFSQKRARIFSFFINLAIYLRAGLAVLNRTIRSIALPIADLFALLTVFFSVGAYYSDLSGINYPPDLIKWGFFSYSLVWIITIWLSGGYDRPLSIRRILRGVLLGAGLILIGYALLPENYRFSRALILLGSAGTLLYFLLSRWLLTLALPDNYTFENRRKRRFGIVGDDEEFKRVGELLNKTSVDAETVEHIPVKNSSGNTLSGADLDEFCRVYKLNEIIFCAKDIASQDIIKLMSTSGTGIDYKIAPPESLYLIGSNSIDTAGDLLVVEFNSINKSVNRRLKRMMDIGFSLLFLLCSPLILVFVSNRSGFLRNLFQVLLGRWSWVGFAGGSSGNRLPSIKPGVVNPSTSMRGQTLEQDQIDRLNWIYAKDYHLLNDVKLLFGSLRSWGERPSVLNQQ